MTVKLTFILIWSWHEFSFKVSSTKSTSHERDLISLLDFIRWTSYFLQFIRKIQITIKFSLYLLLIPVPKRRCCLLYWVSFVRHIVLYQRVGVIWDRVCIHDSLVGVYFRESHLLKSTPLNLNSLTSSAMGVLLSRL